MSSILDYKWRRRLCHKWHKEQLMELKLVPSSLDNRALESLIPPFPLPSSASIASTTLANYPFSPRATTSANAYFANFVDDPTNMRKLFLSRHHIKLLSQRCDFKLLATNCFVRAKVNNDYHIGQIVGFGNWSNIPIDQTLLLRIDNNPKLFRLDQLANTYYTYVEFIEWEYTWLMNKFELPTRHIVEEKYKALTEAKLQLTAMNNDRNVECLDNGNGMDGDNDGNINSCNSAKNKACLVHDYHSALRAQDTHSAKHLFDSIQSIETAPQCYHYHHHHHHHQYQHQQQEQQQNQPEQHLLQVNKQKHHPHPIPSTLVASSCKYPVEPMDAYKPYLHLLNEKSKSESKAAKAKPASIPNEEKLRPIKRRISLDEYRQRRLKINNNLNLFNI